MRLDGITIGALDEGHLRGLVADGVPESKTIEYKRDAIGTTPADKREFLNDATSFANASGGWLFLGVEAKDGKPVGIPGLDAAQADNLVLRLEQSMSTGVRPRLWGVRSQAVPLTSGRCVIAIRIPQSWNGPHMVSVDYKGHERFFTRTSAGKHGLDVDELRQAFLRSEGIADQMRRFRAGRLAAVVSGETPLPLCPGPVALLHVIPFSGASAAQSLPIGALAADAELWRTLNLGNSRINFDGLLHFVGSGERTLCPRYFQLFRNGAAEFADTRIGSEYHGKLSLQLQAQESTMLEWLDKALRVQRHVGISPPIAVLVSLVGVKGYSIPWEWAGPFFEPVPIDRDVLQPPEVILDAFDSNRDAQLKPAFDALWNAAGLPQSRGYNEDGSRR